MCGGCACGVILGLNDAVVIGSFEGQAQAKHRKHEACCNVSIPPASCSLLWRSLESNSLSHHGEETAATVSIGESLVLIGLPIEIPKLGKCRSARYLRYCIVPEGPLLLKQIQP